MKEEIQRRIKDLMALSLAQWSRGRIYGSPPYTALRLFCAHGKVNTFHPNGIASAIVTGSQFCMGSELVERRGEEGDDGDAVQV